MHGLYYYLLRNIKFTWQKHMCKHLLSVGTSLIVAGVLLRRQVWLHLWGPMFMCLCDEQSERRTRPPSLQRWTGEVVFRFCCCCDGCSCALKTHLKKKWAAEQLHSWLHLWVTGLQGTKAKPLKAGYNFAAVNAAKRNKNWGYGCWS